MAIPFFSQEGTTQGDPLAMLMYALAILPLIRRIADNVQQAWYADDAIATGSLKNLRIWWDKLVTVGPSYGYFVNAVKTWLITKEETHTRALDIFKDTQIRITKEGKPHLGAALGTSSYITEFVKAKVKNWSLELEQLASIANTQPHAAFSALTHGLASRWVYVARTIPNIGHLLQPLDELLRTKFIPLLTGRAAPSDLERELLALPAHLGGLGLLNPSHLSTTEYSASMKVTQPLVDHIIKQDETYGYEILQDQLSAKAEVHKSKREQHSNAASTLKDILPPSLAHAMDLSQEKGASTWLSVLPLEEYGFALHKGAFRDALALHYSWSPGNAPLNCACGTHFSVEHVLSCPKGGYPSIRHNEIRDLTAALLLEVCHNVSTASSTTHDRPFPNPKCLGDIYGHLNMSLVRSVARAIMRRENVRIELAPDSSQHLSDAVGMFNRLVPAEDSIKVEDFLSSAISQGKLSEKLDNQLLSSLVEASTVANKARLLSVSSPHAASWLSMPPCERQGLHLEPSQFQVAVKWWLGLDTSGDAQCALCPEKSFDPLCHHATTCKRGGDVVYRHNRLRDIVAESCRRAHLSVHLEVGHNLTTDHSNTDILLPHWCMGKPAALDLSVTSPLNPLTLLEAGVTAGAAAKATEERKLKANTGKCADLGWVCVPVVAESYGAWGLTARDTWVPFGYIIGEVKHPFLWHPLGCLTSEQGVQQSDPLGPLLFSLVLNIHVSEISSRGNCSLNYHAWYLDDSALAGPGSSVYNILAMLQELGPPLGLHVNIDSIRDAEFCHHYIAHKRLEAQSLLSRLDDVGLIDPQVALTLLPAYIASSCSSRFGSKTNDHLCSAVAYFNPNVPPDMALQIDAILSAPSVQQNKLSSMLDTHMFNLMLENSSTADRARLLSVSSAHASPWLSVVPSQGLGLHHDPPVYQIAIKWWLGLDTSQGSQCALCPGIALNPLGPPWTSCHHLSAFDISVTSPLNTLTLLEAGVSAGSAAQATETRKHMANDAKCNELGWLCVPLVAETYGAWGKEAMEAFSQLASRLATHTCRLKSAVTFELYSRLNLHLVRANATAILTRCIQS
ncbi:hypothetical protein EMCRGX_G007111 [Ephydatia muelleri]